jgi:integrase
MASIYRHAKGWRVQVYVNGARESAVFDTKARAAAWALEREAQLSGKKLPDKDVSHALERYARDVSPTKAGERWEVNRLTNMGHDKVAKRPLVALEAADLADYRDRRLRSVSASTVRREMVLLNSVLEIARKEWGWIRINPQRDVKKPVEPPSRKRRITDEEIRRICLAFGFVDRLESRTAMHRTGLAFLFALETACRAGEIIGLTGEHAHLTDRFIHLPRTKNGDARDVPLSSRAVEILQALPGNVFDLNPGTRDNMFRRARDASGCVNLHFHDSRAEAIWRLSKKFDVLELARVIGHRDVRSLMLYFNTSASELAKRLD